MTVTCHLAIDAVGTKHSGAATVLNAVVDAAIRSSGVQRVTVFCSPASQRDFKLPTDDKLRVVDAPLGECGPGGRIAWQYLRLPALARCCGADVLLCLSGGGLPPKGTPAVLFVQQSLPFCDEAMATLPFRQRLRARVLAWNMGIAARRSAAVAVQTSTMSRWVCQRFGLPIERVKIFEPCPTPAKTTNGAQELKEMRESTAVARFLYVGNGSAYKNLGILSDAMECLRRKHINARLFVTLAPGHPLLTAPGVVALGHLPMPVLSEAYRLATALVMPSLVETVGLPMLEAFQAGTPVVAADRPYAHDVCGEAALYFDPHISDVLARHLEEIASDPVVRIRLSEAGLRIARARTEVKPYDALVVWLVKLAWEAHS